MLTFNIRAEDLSLNTIPSYSQKQFECPKLHLAIDANAIEDRASRNRGIGVYLARQFSALLSLKPEWKFTFCGIGPQPIRELDEIFSDFSNYNYTNWENLLETNADLLYLPNPMGFATPHIIEIGKIAKLPIVCTFHDLIPLIFRELYLDKNFRYSVFYMNQLEQLRTNCILFLCNSNCTARDLQERIGIPISRLKVIYAGINNESIQPPSKGSVEALLWNIGVKSGEYLLFTGVPDQRKNSQGMFAALSIARRVLNKDLRLIIAGDCPNFLVNKLRHEHLQLGLPEQAVIFTGYVSDDVLNTLYSGALVLLFPSLYEGFGLPIVEAMQAGLPVIAGNNSSQIEVAGDAAILVDVYNHQEIADAIIRLYNDSNLRQRLIQKGWVQCKRFNWKNTAELTAKYLEEAFVSKKVNV